LNLTGGVTRTLLGVGLPSLSRLLRCGSNSGDEKELEDQGTAKATNKMHLITSWGKVPASDCLFLARANPSPNDFPRNERKMKAEAPMEKVP